jgi:hypothetical protein
MQKSPAGLTASPWLSSCTAGCTSCCTAGCTERRAASRRAHQSLKVSARERIALVPEKEAPKRQMHCTCACLPSELRVVLSGAAASGRVAGAPSKTTPSERYVVGKKKRVQQQRTKNPTCLFVSQREKRSKRGAACCRWLPRRPGRHALSQHLVVQESNPGPVASKRRRWLPREESAKTPHSYLPQLSKKPPAPGDEASGRKPCRTQRGFSRTRQEKDRVCATEGTYV